MCAAFLMGTVAGEWQLQLRAPLPISPSPGMEMTHED